MGGLFLCGRGPSCGRCLVSGARAGEQLAELLRREMVRLGVRRKSAAMHIVAEFGGGARNLTCQVGVLPRELRRTAESEAEEIVQDEHLAIAIGSGADTNSGDVKFFGDAGAKFARHGFEHYGKCTGCFHSARVAIELV